MSTLEWTLWVLAIGISLVGVTFAFSNYFNRRRRPKKVVLARAVIISFVLLSLVYVIGYSMFVKAPNIAESSNSLDLPPHIELSREFSMPEGIPSDDQPLFEPVPELYVWKNSGGPIYHSDVQIIDIIEVSVGNCGELDTFQTRPFALLNPSHYSSVIRDDQIELPFFGFHISSNAVHGVELDSESDLLAAYAEKFRLYLNAQSGTCGHLSRREILVKFTFVDIRGTESALLYRFGRLSPFETLRQEQWTQIMSQIEAPDNAIGFTFDDLEEPCRIVRFARGGNLTNPC